MTRPDPIGRFGRLLVLHLAVEMLHLRFWLLVGGAALLAWLSGSDVRR